MGVIADGVRVGAAGGGSGDISDPTDIDGCQLWLDASQLDLEDDDPVATWPDLSGNGYDAGPASQNEIQTIDITGAESGSYRLVSDDDTSELIDWDATAAEVKSALEALSDIGVGNVQVTLDAQVYTVEFIDALAGTPIVDLTSADETLNTGSPSFNEVQPGATFDPPTYKADIQNGLPVVRFDGSMSPQCLDLVTQALGLFRNLDGITVAMVYSNTSGADGVVFAVSNSDGQVDLFIAQLAVTGDDTHHIEFDIGNSDDISSQIVPGVDYAVPAIDIVNAVVAWHLSSVVVESDFFLTDLGFSYSSFTPGPLPDVDAAKIRVGASTVASALDIGLYLTGDVAELIVYNRALSARERRQLLEYLSAKWGTL